MPVPLVEKVLQVYPPGTVRRWHDGRDYVKQQSGEWEPRSTASSHKAAAPSHPVNHPAVIPPKQSEHPKPPIPEKASPSHKAPFDLKFKGVGKGSGALSAKSSPGIKPPNKMAPKPYDPVAMASKIASKIEREKPKSEADLEHKKIDASGTSGKNKPIEALVKKHIDTYDYVMTGLKKVLPEGVRLKGHVKDPSDVKSEDPKSLSDLTVFNVACPNEGSVEETLKKIKKRYGDQVEKHGKEAASPRGRTLSFMWDDGLKRTINLSTQNQVNHGNWLERFKKHQEDQPT